MSVLQVRGSGPRSIGAFMAKLCRRMSRARAPLRRRVIPIGSYMIATEPLDPALVEHCEDIAADPFFWSALGADDIEARVLALEPVRLVITLDDDYLDDVAAGFAKVVDSKSPYTSGHSDRVALFTDLIAEAMGLSAERRRWLKRAALLHDIGKLGVSNQVLDKPGKLDDAEWTEIKRHPVLGETILSRIAAFADMARIAATHHEKLDGSGYPSGLTGDEISAAARIVAICDVFDALTSVRPYKQGATPEAAAATMATWKGHFDQMLLDKFFKFMGLRHPDSAIGTNGSTQTSNTSLGPSHADLDDFHFAACTPRPGA